MKLSLSWLKKYVAINVAPEKIAQRLLLSGTKVEEITKSNGEVVFELEITPNRPDELSVVGIAREVSALFEKELNLPEETLTLAPKDFKNKVDFKVKEKDLCPGFSIVKLNITKVKDSPSWIAHYLKLSGVRPINNVVDITNFVMLELGQPMHAFDAKKIVGKLTLRSAKQGESVTTLDGAKRTLDQGAIIIEDEEKLVDLAGLMGGKNSEIDETTSEIILIAPLYNSNQIRKTSLQTGLRTEASTRFEKGIDPNLHPYALNRALKLFIEEIGAIQESALETVGFPVKERSINFNVNKAFEVLGIKLTQEKIFELLTPLGFRLTVSPLHEEELLIQIPSFRTDISLEEDIVEELGRMYGYNNFPKTLPKGSPPVQKELFLTKLEEKFVPRLLEFGYHQLTGYSLVSKNDLEKFNFPISKAVKILNPTSADFEYLRPSLLINLIKAFAVNNSYEKNCFFEIAKEFFSELDKKTNLPKQNEALVVANDFSFGKLKGEIEDLLSLVDLEFEQVSMEQNKIWKSGAAFKIRNKVFALVGSLNLSLTTKFGVKRPLFAAWLDLESLKGSKVVENYKTLPRFPSIKEDISFFLPENQTIANVIAQLTQIDKTIDQVTLKDAYLKENKRSFTLSFEFRDQSKTLENKDIVPIRKKIFNLLTRKFGAEIRDN